MAMQSRHNDFYKDNKMFDSISKEQQIAWLNEIIQKEIEKADDEVDADLILECTEFLAELTSDEILYTEQELEQKLQQIKEKASTDEQNSVEDLPQKDATVFQNKPKKRRVILKVAAVLAATLVLFFATVSVVAISQGYSVSEFISMNIEKIKGMGAGDRLEGEKITLIKNGVSAEYGSVEEAIRKGDLNIMYPSVLPEGVKIQKILVTHQGDESNYTITFMTNVADFKYAINSKQKIHVEDWEEISTYETKENIFYIHMADNRYQAVCYIKGLEYNILCENYNELIQMLDGLKGMEL